jgi:hypothetical protein
MLQKTAANTTLGDTRILCEPGHGRLSREGEACELLTTNELVCHLDMSEELFFFTRGVRGAVYATVPLLVTFILLIRHTVACADEITSAHNSGFARVALCAGDTELIGVLCSTATPPIASTDVDIVACKAGAVAACGVVDSRLSQICSTINPGSANAAYCQSYRLVTQTVVTALRRKQTICDADPNSSDCTESGKRAELSEGAFGIVAGMAVENPGKYLDSIPHLFRARVSSITWTFDELKAGDCTTRKGATLTLTPAVNGNIDLHYVARMYTSGGMFGFLSDIGSGDVWHVTWEFYDGSHQLLIRTNRFDLPDGGHMRPGDTQDSAIDFHRNLKGGVARDSLDKLIGGSVIANNEC